MKLYLLFCLLAIHGSCGQGKVLLHVHAIFRHGDRAPINSVSNVLNRTKLWPNGLGQLTDIGINQQFQLGQWLRQRYDGFLNRKYVNEEIYVRSTDVDRTLMSAQSNLAGLYNHEDNIVIPNIRWRPIPIHTIPEIFDIVMLQTDCEKYNIKLREMFRDPHFESTLKEYEYTLDFLRRTLKNPDLELRNLWMVYDALFAEETHELSWDNWVTKELYRNLTMLNQLNWKIMYHGDELAKLSGGLFLNEVVTKLKSIASNSSSGRREKLHLYSGHDTDIAALMSAIGIYNNIQPPYASCFIIELWSKSPTNNNSLENVYVKMYYKNSTGEVYPIVHEVHLKTCESEECTLAEFIDIVQPRTIAPSDYKSHCFAKQFDYLMEIIVVLLVLLIVFLIIHFIYWKMKQ